MSRDKSKVTALQLADYIVNRFSGQNRPITNLQLQKMLFYVQSECLKKGITAFDDDIQAWRLGPVVPNVYRKYSIFGGFTIAWSLDDVIEIPENIREVTDEVTDKLRLLHGWSLVEMSHKGVWKDYFDTDYVYVGYVIPKSEIEKDTTYEEYYERFRAEDTFTRVSQ